MRFPILLVVAAVSVAASGTVFAQQRAQYGKDALVIVRNNNEFALELYGQLRQQQGNVFFSPYSISSALAMTYGGARGKTADAMAKTLHFTVPPARFHPAFGELVHGFDARSAKRPYQLNVANALWGQKGFTFLPAFLKLTQDQYEAGLKELDFVRNTEGARQTINAWVEDKTQDKIKNLIQKGMLSSDTRLVLTNAIYFKAPWENEFFEQATRDGPFTLVDGSTAKVPMMHKYEKLAYLEGDNFQAVTLPYKDQGLSMVVLLPKKADGLPALEKSLTAANLDQWLQKMDRYLVNLKLPKFKITAEYLLREELSRLGMAIAFSSKADFRGITSQQDLFISQVIHKAFVDVNEKGTEAAAATAVLLEGSGVPQKQKEATFHADRPFLFLIRENQTGSILFMGRVVNPKG